MPSLLHQVDGSFVVIGGCSQHHGTDCYDSVQAFDRINYRWSEMEQKLARPRAFHAAVALPEELQLCT